MPLTSGARQITNALTCMPVSVVLRCADEALGNSVGSQLIEAATDDAVLDAVTSLASSPHEEHSLGRISHNFGATKSRSQVRNFLRRNPVPPPPLS
jgi:hypothetical protein